MKKIKVLALISVVFALVFNAYACGHKHEYGVWKSNGDGTHTRVCSDVTHSETEDCSGGTATCASAAICEKCNNFYGEKLPHTFTAEVADDDYLVSRATCQSKAVYYKSCAVCGEVGTDTFEYGEVGDHAFNLKVAEPQYLKSEADCTHKAVYYRSCGTCGTKGTDADTFEYGDCTDHNFIEQAESLYLKSEADCTHKAVYYKSCSDCGTKSEATFEDGDLGAHVFDKRDISSSFAVSGREDMFYYSCSVCGQSSEGQTGEKTFKGYTVQDDSWNIVNDELIHNYADTERKYDSTVRYYLNGGSRVAEDSVSVVYLEDIVGGVGGREEGIYYKVEPETVQGGWYGFNILPKREKSVYEALVTINPSAALTFDVYCVPTGGNDGQIRLIHLNKTAFGQEQLTVNGWKNCSVPVSTLITNWEDLNTATYSAPDTAYRSRALFNYNPVFGGATDASFVYYIGNFSVAGLDEALHPENYIEDWNAIDASLITSDTNNSTVRYFLNNQTMQPTYKNRITVTDLADIEGGVGGKTDGKYYKVAPNAKQGATIGIAVMPKNSKELYEEFIAINGNENATLDFDVYVSPVGGYDGNNRLTYINGQVGNAGSETNKWLVQNVKLSDIIQNWDTYGVTSSESTGIAKRVLFAYNTSYNSISDEVGSYFYIGNFRISGFKEWLTNKLTTSQS